jgi:hypothetical protein
MIPIIDDAVAVRAALPTIGHDLSVSIFFGKKNFLMVWTSEKYSFRFDFLPYLTRRLGDHLLLLKIQDDNWDCQLLRFPILWSTLVVLRRHLFRIWSVNTQGG